MKIRLKSITYAMKAKDLLQSHGIDSAVVRDLRLAGSGCVYAIIPMLKFWSFHNQDTLIKGFFAVSPRFLITEDGCFSTTIRKVSSTDTAFPTTRGRPLFTDTVQKR